MQKSYLNLAVILCLTTSIFCTIELGLLPNLPEVEVLENGGVANCQNWDNESSCQGQATENPADWANRNFQTPPRGDPLHTEAFQDYNLLQGYVRMTYGAGMSNVNLFVYTRVNPSVGTFKIKYIFDGVAQDSETKTVDSSHKQVMDVKLQLINGGGDVVANLHLEPVDFYWNHPTVNQPSQYNNGQKGAIVELFGWRYEDVAKECVMLGKAGYMGVKVFPPNESLLDFAHPENGEMNPWFWLYQPVSYKLTSRQGTVEELRTMINTCRSNNVRVFADAVVNHMTGNGNDMNPTHCAGNVIWNGKNSSAGSPFYTHGFAFENSKVTGQRPGGENPAVPYGPLDFHCARTLSSWTDGFVLNFGWLVNLSDLNTESDYVRQRIADYFTELISIGISGVRVDAAKHISPDNLAAIFGKLKTNLGGKLTPDFSAYLEVIIGGEKDLLECNENNYDYAVYFTKSMQKAGLSDDDIYKIKIWSSDYPKEHPVCGRWPIPQERFVVQNDCHDDQNPGSSSRDMQSFGSVYIKDKDVAKHRGFEVQLFTRRDANWQIKLVLSSYSFVESKGANGPPDGSSDCARCVGPLCNQCSKSVPYTPGFDDAACGYSNVENGQWKEGKYTRVHRDVSIINAMRGWMGLAVSNAPESYGLAPNCQ